MQEVPRSIRGSGLFYFHFYPAILQTLLALAPSRTVLLGKQGSTFSEVLLVVTLTYSCESCHLVQGLRERMRLALGVKLSPSRIALLPF